MFPYSSTRSDFKFFTQITQHSKHSLCQTYYCSICSCVQTKKVRGEKMIFNDSVLVIWLHFCFVAIDAVSETKDHGRSRRAFRGVQAPHGKCLSFELDRGRNKTMIEYVCCNNCNQTNQTCVNTTYGSGSNSTDVYCNRCGRSSLHSAKKSSVPFTCGGCRNQTDRNNICRAVYNSTIRTECWLLPACFRHKCNFSLGTCFNGTCDAGENVDNCPADCCPQKNPQNCSLGNETCPLKCCSRSSCCLDTVEEEDGDSGGGGFTLVDWIQYVGIIIAIVVIGGIIYKKCGCGDDNNEVHPTENA